MSKKFLSDVLIECGLQVSGATTLGTATATTVATSDNSTNIATTAWVKALGYSTTDSFISDVTFNGASLSFTGTNSAFTGSLDLSALQTQLTDIETVYATVRNVSGGLILKGTPLAVVIGQTAGNVSDVIPADASDPALMPALFIADEDIAEEAEGRAVAYGEIAGIDTSLYPSGTTVYVAPGGGWTDIKPTGTDLIQNLGVVTKQHNTNGGGIVTGVGRSNDVPNIPQGYAWVGNANGVATPTLLGSLAYSSATYDNYVSWNLKTNGVQRTTVQSGGNLDIVAGTDISVSYGAGGVVTINSTATGSIDYISDIALNGNSLDFTGTGNAFAGSIDLSSLNAVSAISDLTDVDLTGLTNNAILKYDSVNQEWVVSTSNDTANATATAIVPFAIASVNTTNNGSGIGISWSNWNSSNSSLDFTFTTAQPDTNYIIITDSEVFDDFFVGISNKTTTGFRAEFYDNSQSRTPSSFSEFSFIVYASDPTQQIKSSVGGINELSDVDTVTSTPSNGEALVWDGTNWVPGTISTTNNYLTGLSFNTTDGVLTATRQGLTDLTVDLDGRYLTSETLTELSIASNILSYRDETGAVTEIDLSLYLDDTNLARITSGTVDAEGVATFTRDDSSTFTVDFSSLISTSTDTLADVTGRGATTSNTIEFTGAANAYVGIQGETDVNLKIGTGAGSEPRMYLFGSANGQSNAGNVFIGTANNTGVVDINGDVDISGDVGIGTSTPQDKLDVNGIVNSSRSIVSNSVYTIFTGRSNRTINDYGGLNKQYFKLNLVTPGPNTTGEASAHGFADLRFQLANNAGSTSVADIMTLRAGGNVGIGTTTPTERLEVTGNIKLSSIGTGNNASSYGLLFYGTTSSGTQTDQAKIHSSPWATNTNGGNLQFYTSTSANTLAERMRITGDGNVGIGTDDPNQLLHTVGGTVKIESDGGNAAGAVLELKHANNNTTDVCATINFTNNVGGYAAIEGGTTDANNTGYLAFKTDNAGTQGEAVRILGNGNVGVGTTSPKAKMHIGPDALVSGYTPSTTTLAVSDITNGAELILRGQSPRLWFDATAGGDGEIYMDGTNLVIYSGNPTSAGNSRFSIDSSGNVRFAAYGAGLLTSDASGNITVDTSTYLTSYTETDTLDSVTDRGATTTNAIQVGGFLAASTVDTNSTTKAEMLTNAVAKFKPHVLNSGSLAIAQVDNGNSVGLQFTNGAGTADWDIALQPFGGNVGIGKVNPAGALHVYSGTSERFLIDGDVKVMGSTDFNITGANRRFSFTNGAGTIRTTTANKLYLETNSTTAITIDANQNVGIGDTNPTSSKLSVVGTVGVIGAYGSQSPDLNQGSAGWHKLGTLLTGQSGRNLKLEFNAGQGYNANYGQHSILHIVFRTSNGSSQNNGIYASCHWYTEGFVSLVNEVRVRQIDTSTYEFYVDANAFTGLSFVKAETSLYDEWINDFQRDIEEPVIAENEVFSAYELYAIHSNIRGFHALHTDGILSTDADLGVGTQTPTFTSGSGIEVQRTGTATLRLDSGSMATELRAYTDGTFLGQLSASYLDLGTNNTTRVRITSDGNVGIGTTTPGSAFKLDVNGYIKANSRVYVRDSTKTVEIGTDYIQSYVTSGTGVNPIRFFTGSTEKARIDGNGNVGVGTTSPQAKVHSKGEIRVDYNDTDGSTYITGYGVEFERGANYLRPRATDGTQTLYLGSAGDDLDWNNINFKTSSHSQFRVAGSDIMRINSTGVGIGTTNPTEELHVEGEVKIQPKHTTGTPPSLYLGDLNNQYQSGMSSSGHLTFRSTSNTYFQSGGANYRMTIDGPTGNVYIGGTTTASEKLEVDGNIKSSGYLIIGGDDAARIALGSGTGNPVPQTIASFGSNVHIGAFVDFTIYNETKEHMRSGTLQLVFNANEVRFNEASTMDIGDTSACLLTAVNNAGVVSVLFEAPDPTFHIKYQTRTI